MLVRTVMMSRLWCMVVVTAVLTTGSATSTTTTTTRTSHPFSSSSSFINTGSMDASSSLLLERVHRYQLTSGLTMTIMAINDQHQATPILSLPKDGQAHPRSMSISLSAFDRQFVLHMRTNDDLFSADYKHVHMDAQGKVIKVETDVARNCHYVGTVFGDSDSKVVASTCFGYVNAVVRGHGHEFAIDGAVHHFEQAGRLQELHQHFQTASAAASSSEARPLHTLPHIIYQLQDFQTQEGTCGVHSTGQHAHATPFGSIPLSTSHEDAHQHADHAHHDHNQAHDGHSHSATVASSSSSSSLPKQFSELTSTTCNGHPTKYVETFYFNDYSRYTALGSNTQTASASIFNYQQYYYTAASSFACAISVKLAGQITFVQGNPSALTYRSCGTTDTRYANAYTSADSKYNKCCNNTGDPATNGCGTAFPNCIPPSASVASDRSVAACWRNTGPLTGSTSYGGSSQSVVTYWDIDLTSPYVSQLSTEVDTNLLLTNFNTYVFQTVKTTLQSVFSPSKVDSAQLLSARDFQGPVLGVAKVGSMCSYESGSIIQADSPSYAYVASTTTHEMGHTFGMYHDLGTSSPTNACPISGYIMAPAADASSFGDTFSTCSTANINTYFSSWYGASTYNPTCLDNNPGTPDPYAARCGNGVVDAGEQCDSGFSPTADSCCTSTCQFAANCNCSNLNPCCSNGQIVPYGAKVCRAASDATCDYAETCDGLSQYCPTDRYKSAGTTCGSGSTSTCYHGTCVPSANAQCTTAESTSSTFYAATSSDYAPMCTYFNSTTKLGALICRIGNYIYYTEQIAAPGTVCGTGYQCNSQYQCVSQASLKSYGYISQLSSCNVTTNTTVRSFTCVDEALNVVSSAMCSTSQPASYVTACPSNNYAAYNPVSSSSSTGVSTSSTTPSPTNPSSWSSSSSSTASNNGGSGGGGGTNPAASSSSSSSSKRASSSSTGAAAAVSSSDGGFFQSELAGVKMYIIIPVLVCIGLAALVLLLCLYRCCCVDSKPRRRSINAVPNYMHNEPITPQPKMELQPVDVRKYSADYNENGEGMAAPVTPQNNHASRKYSSDIDYSGQHLATPNNHRSARKSSAGSQYDGGQGYVPASPQSQADAYARKMSMESVASHGAASPGSGAYESRSGQHLIRPPVQGHRSSISNLSPSRAPQHASPSPMRLASHPIHENIHEIDISDQPGR